MNNIDSEFINSLSKNIGSVDKNANSTHSLNMNILIGNTDTSVVNHNMRNFNATNTKN